MHFRCSGLPKFWGDAMFLGFPIVICAVEMLPILAVAPYVAIGFYLSLCAVVLPFLGEEQFE